MKKLSLFFCLLAAMPVSVLAQQEPAWDNTKNKNWGAEFKQVEIPSSADGSRQKAWFHPSSKSTAQPLIVSLHTWSGDYNQEDPLAREVLLRDWNYIHPDFRGPNNKPEACGSDLVLQDLLDAIRFAVKNARVDTASIHIIGVSGGGYLTLLAYMKLPYPVRSFTAWAPISDLTAWYWESRGRHNKYAEDLQKVAWQNGKIDLNEWKRRSPLSLPVPSNRSNASLYIFEGVHDGYQGSVPITHSVFFYNKIARALYPSRKDAIMPESVWTSILSKQCYPAADSNYLLGGRLVQWQKRLPKISLTLFEGGHEMLVPQALSLLPIGESNSLDRLHIITIGDSNGAFDFGWPQQLQKLLPYSTLINHSIAGNTIGFDNLGRKELNTLRNIDLFLEDACHRFGPDHGPDYLFIGLGTNDTKRIFMDRQQEVPANLDSLLHKIHAWFKSKHLKTPKICVITPAPMDEARIDTAKYGGGDQRIRFNNIAFEKVVRQRRDDFLNSYSILKAGFPAKTIDGIHLKPAAQFELASLLVTYMLHKK